MLKTNHRTSFAARLMLMLAVLQFVFVAFEAAGVIHGADDDKQHHEVVVNIDAVHAMSSDLNAPSDLNEDICDHCCHCHGHGTHFSLHPSQNLVFIAPMSALLLSNEKHFRSTDLHSIHRPPIV